MTSRDQPIAPQGPEPGTLARSLLRLLRGCSSPAEDESLAARVREQPEPFLSLCAKNVIGVRTLEALESKGLPLGEPGTAWLGRERARVARGVEVIASITAHFERHDVPFMVIKTGDHYPDQGHDVDLFVAGDGDRAVDLLRRELGAETVDRSFSEVMAAKTNLEIGSVTVELHAGRLGQLGEHRRLAREMFELRRRGRIGATETWVPSAEGQVILSLLQRIYRHFNFRICDVLNLARLVESPSLRRERLWRMCRKAGIADGAALGIGMVDELLARVDGGLHLEPREPVPRPCPHPLSFRRDFYRFPLAGVVPRVYLRQLGASIVRGSGLQAALLVLLGLLMTFVGLNIRFLPSVPIWRKLW